MNKVFQARVTDMIKSADLFQRTLLAIPGQSWMRFKPDYVPHSQDQVSAPFDRETLGGEYQVAMEAAGKQFGSRDALVAKMQSDFLSSLNQATVLRHRTRLQCVAAAVGRAAAHAGYKLEDMLLRPVATLEATPK